MTPMTRADVARLLTFAAAYDQRTIGDADVLAWHQTAIAGRWQLAHAQRVIVEHYSDNTDRLMPAHITRRLRDLRAHYATTYRHTPYPPGLTDIDAQTAWERQQIDQHITDHMDQWAAGDEAA